MIKLDLHVDISGKGVVLLSVNSRIFNAIDSLPNHPYIKYYFVVLVLHVLLDWLVYISKNRCKTQTDRKNQRLYNKATINDLKINPVFISAKNQR